MGLFGKSKKEQAQELTQKGLEIFNIDPRSLTALEKYYGNTEKCKEAIEYFDNASKLDPKNPTIWFYKGITQAKFRQFISANLSFDKALKLDPKNPTTLFCKGWMLRYSEYKPEEAIQYFQKAIEICPAGRIWYEIGLIQLSEQRNIEEARKSFDKAFEQDPNNIELIKLTLEHDRFEGLLSGYVNTFLSNYLSRNQKDAEAWYLKGETLTAIENYENASECYLRAVDINPEKYSFLDEKIKKIKWLKDSNQHSVQLGPSETIIGKFFCEMDTVSLKAKAILYSGQTISSIRGGLSHCCILTNYNLYFKNHNKLEIVPLEKISSIQDIGNWTLSIKYGSDKTDEHIVAFKNKAFSQFNSSLVQAMATKRDKIERNVRGNTIIDFSSIKEYLKNGGVVMQTFKCPGCGASLEFPDNVDTTTCQYCGNKIKAVDLFEKIKSIL